VRARNAAGFELRAIVPGRTPALQLNQIRVVIICRQFLLAA
jgi:hypothetical protein